jgi:uncharacterized DUF497 family protein
MMILIIQTKRIGSSCWALSAKLRVLMVSHAFRDDERVVRIISARKATKGEESAYWRKS